MLCGWMPRTDATQSHRSGTLFTSRQAGTRSRLTLTQIRTTPQRLSPVSRLQSPDGRSSKEITMTNFIRIIAAIILFALLAGLYAFNEYQGIEIENEYQVYTGWDR